MRAHIERTKGPFPSWPVLCFCKGMLLALFLSAAIIGWPTKQQAVFAADFEPIKLAYVDFPPFTYTENGQPAGALLAFAQDVLEQAGTRYEMIELPVSRLYQDIAAGRIHVWMGPPKNEAIRGSTYSGSVILGSMNIMLYGLGDTPPPSLDSLRAEKLIILKGYVYNGRINALAAPDRALELLPASSHADALRMLQAKRASYLLDYQRPLMEAAQATGVSGLMHRRVEEIHTYFLVSKKAPDPARLLKLLDAGAKLQLGQNQDPKK